VDSILLEGIVVPAALGVSKAEREMRRPVDIDLELATDLKRAGESDRLAHTLDYGQVYRDVERIAGEREYRLVEALAEQIAQTLLASYAIESCTVAVRKRSRPDRLRLLRAGRRREARRAEEARHPRRQGDAAPFGLGHRGVDGHGGREGRLQRVLSASRARPAR
jgi:dihydroneopterin aldolase